MLASAPLAHAALIGLARSHVPPTPDITVAGINVTYNSGTGLFKANGYPASLDLDFYPPPDDHTINSSLDTDWLLQVTIPSSGPNAGKPTSGSLTVKGGIPTLGIPDGTTLLTGTLQIRGTNINYPGVDPAPGFGYFGGAGSNPDLFEFVFDTTGGALVPTYYQTFPHRIDIILNAGATGFNGSFAASFNNDGFSGTADLFPEPSSILLAVVGGALLGMRPLRRRLSAFKRGAGNVARRDSSIPLASPALNSAPDCGPPTS